jgi:hypothetical protein
MPPPAVGTLSRLIAKARPFRPQTLLEGIKASSSLRCPLSGANPGLEKVWPQIKDPVPDVQKAAPTVGLQTQIINATTVGEINEVFATFERERPDALFVAGDAFLTSCRVQLATLTAPTRFPRLIQTVIMWKSAG